MGPDFIVVVVSVDFIDEMDSSGVESAVTRLNGQIKSIDSRIGRVFIEAERSGRHRG